MIKQLSQHYRLQLQDYRRLALQTKELLAAVQNSTAGSGEQLLLLLAERQKLLDAIEERQKNSLPLWSALQEKLGFQPQAEELPRLFPTAEAKAVAAAHGEIQRLLQQILANDELIRSGLADARAQLQQELQTMQRRRQAARSYSSSPAQNTGIFLDQKKS
ncbi:MAG: flagellar protein FliT [Firmicutes bacterium]|nr:flagellar protein FliT [Bacillota bacterium]